MVDSRQKGARGEIVARDLLRKSTGLPWERTPSSGALHSNHKLKGDLYVPNEKNRFLIEVKHYKEDQLSSKILVNKGPTIHEWWDKACRQAKETDKRPMVMYKWDRSKWYIIVDSYFQADDLEDKYIEFNTGLNIGIVREYTQFFDAFSKLVFI